MNTSDKVSLHVHVCCYPSGCTCTVHGCQTLAMLASEYKFAVLNVGLKPYSMQTTVYSMVVLLLMHAVS